MISLITSSPSSYRGVVLVPFWNDIPETGAAITGASIRPSQNVIVSFFTGNPAQPVVNANATANTFAQLATITY
jgi:hypothetical protein